MKLLQIVAILILINRLALAQDLSGFAGAFADIGFGSRPAALGNAFVGLSNDVNSITWNPAGVSKLTTMQSCFSFTSLLGLINYNYLAFGMPLNEGQGLGVGLIASGDDALREYTLNLAYSRKILIENLFVGVGVKLRYASFGKNSLTADDYVLFEPDEIQEGLMNQVKGSATGLGLDIGVLYDVNERIRVGLMFKDIYSPMFWNSSVDNPNKQAKGKYTELIPFEPTIGTAFNVSDNLLITTDYTSVLLKDVSDKLRTGVEIKMFKIVSIRGGMQQFLNNLKDEKYSFGLGLNVGLSKNMRVTVDYTYMLEQLANTQRFSLGLEF